MDEEKSVYSCPVCSKKFKEKNALEQHIKNKKDDDHEKYHKMTVEVPKTFFDQWEEFSTRLSNHLNMSRQYLEREKNKNNEKQQEKTKDINAINKSPMSSKIRRSLIRNCQGLDF